MSEGKVRFGFFFENTPVAIRVVPHKTNSGLVLLKGAGVVPKLFCTTMGLHVVEEFIGSQFHSAVVRREDFLTAVNRAICMSLDEVLEVEVKTKEDHEAAVIPSVIPEIQDLSTSLDGLS